MRLFEKAKDGGPESPVDAYFLCEFKGLFSIALLKFNIGSRVAFHTHAFNAWTWFLKGEMKEQVTEGEAYGYWYSRSLTPKYTPKSRMHRVKAYKDSWCITIRGPWSKYWIEYNPITKTYTTFTHGRVEV